MSPEAKSSRVLTDFTGDALSLDTREGFDSLLEYETQSSRTTDPEWQAGTRDLWSMLKAAIGKF